MKVKKEGEKCKITNLENEKWHIISDLAEAERTMKEYGQ